ncbi:hypothetical protein J2T50_001362 [Streptococcus gallinaceus]|uniref:Uncharacterized protein n=1 Tax=Streptococcus gallinaceus TaxID=165758 RepID=A0ABV2JLC9_9STRE|nr:hypothetical protein [Streptococcus gallinaceus]MCP1770445.1 hypothetical protein [Streptococcus gallinaceus]
MAYKDYLKRDMVDTSLGFVEFPFWRAASPDKAV